MDYSVATDAKLLKFNTFEEATRYAMESVAAESNTAMVYKGVWPMIRYIKGVGKSILVDEVFY